MARKGMRITAMLITGGLIAASQRQDIARYLKIRQMSQGGGHPENVPASGSHYYPAPDQGAPDGQGDFDSAARGGPAI